LVAQYLLTLMKTLIRDYPIGAIALLLLACVRFEYQTASWSINSPGLAGGLVVLGIIALVLLFRIFNAAQDACISRGLLHSRIHCKYDVLIPIGILAVFVQVRYCGERFRDGPGKSGFRWEFVWGDRDWSVPFFVALVGVVLLIRILYLVRAIAQESDVKH
jgi:hypothetical protein